MVTLEDVPGLEVSLGVDGTLLKEYEDPDVVKVGRCATRHVEVQSEQRFEVLLQFDEAFAVRGRHVRYALHMDGQKITKSHLSLENPTPITCRRAYVIREKDGEMYRRYFKFSQLDLSEDHHTLDQATSLHFAALGTISIEIDYASSSTENRNSSLPAKRGCGSDPVPEKALKGRAVSHAVSFADTITKEKRKSSNSVKQRQPDGLPLARITFKYQSLSALKASGIIPRTPPQLDESVDDDDVDGLESLDADELRARLRCHMKASQVPPHLKKEPIDRSSLLGVDDDGVVVLGQSTARKRSFSEVIDLTDE